MEIKNINYVPKKENIFRSLSDSIYSRKVCIIVKEPCFQEGITTGLSIEEKNDTWSSLESNIILKNILRLIYKSYTGKLEDMSEIINRIENNDFKILKEEFNILNGVPEGRTHSELKIGNSDGGYSYFNIEIYWKDGKIQRHKVTNPVSETDIVFDLEGKGNSIGKDKKKFKDGIAKFDGKIFKCNLNEEKMK